MEQTFIMIKPDGVQRGLIGDIISRFEKKGFYLKEARAWKVEERNGDCGWGFGLLALIFDSMACYVGVERRQQILKYQR